VGGGAPQGVDPAILAGGGYVSGLGINRLHAWWENFLLGKKTGIDLPGEAEGILPSPEWKEERVGDIWRIGDTYNVSIGQGDLLVTPIQLLNYIAAIANGGKIYKPTVNAANSRRDILADLSDLLPQINEVRKGMEKAVTSELGTAHLLGDLGFKIGAKTGTSEVRSKKNGFSVASVEVFVPLLHSPKVFSHLATHSFHKRKFSIYEKLSEDQKARPFAKQKSERK